MTTPLPESDGRLLVPAIAGPDQVEAALDQAWAARGRASDEVARLTAAHLLAHVRAHLPAAAVVVLREDTSHLPAHGHIDAVEDADGRVLLVADGDWHDLAWTGSADEDAWDIYHVLGGSAFVRDPDGVRRLRLRLETA